MSIASGERKEECAAQRIIIRALAQCAILKLLRCHGMNRTDERLLRGVFDPAGFAKVDQLPHTIVGLHEVRGLYIAMQESSTMNRVQRMQGAGGDHGKLMQRKRMISGPDLQGLPAEPFERQIATTSQTTTFTKLDHIESMDLFECGDFTFPLLISRFILQPFQRHNLATALVTGTMHRAAGAFRDLFQHFIIVDHTPMLP